MLLLRAAHPRAIGRMACLACDPRRRRRPPHARRPLTTHSNATAAAAASPGPADPAAPSTSSPTALCTFAATLAYDGTDLAGFQLQARPAGARAPPPVQGALEAALCAVCGAGWVEEEGAGIDGAGRRRSRSRPPPPLPAARAALALQGAGRTDAGVHARGQCVSFRAPARLADGVGSGSKPLAVALNALLPPAIRVTACAPAPPDFSARFSCLSKTYVYYIAAGVAGGGAAGCGDPLLPRYAALTRDALDFDAMAAAATLLVGTHDFSGFATSHAPSRSGAAAGGEGRGRGGAGPRPGGEGEGVRTLTEARVVRVGRGGSGGDGLWHPSPPPSIFFHGDGGGDAFGGGGAPHHHQHTPQLLACVFTGDGFLYRQARHMAAALVGVGSGRVGAGALVAALADGAGAAAARARGGRVPTAGSSASASPSSPFSPARGWTVAPAAGLFLQAAHYPPFPADRGAPMHVDVPHAPDGTVDTVALAARSAAAAGVGVGKGEALAAVRAARAARAAGAERGTE